MKEKTNTFLLSTSRRLVYTALMSAMLIVGKYVIILPQVEIVTTLTVSFAYVFGWLGLAATTVFCAVDMILYPFSIDVAISYFIYWNLLALLVILLKKANITSELPYLILSLIMTLFFGVLTSLMTSLIFGLNFFAVYVMGIYFYIIQFLSTLIFVSLGFKPLTRQLIKLNKLK